LHAIANIRAFAL